MEVPKNDGLVEGASCNDARIAGGDEDREDGAGMSLQRTQSRGVVGVPDDRSLVGGRCDEIFIVRCETARADVILVPSERIQSLSRLHAPLDGRLILRTCVEMETGRGDDDAIDRTFMSLKCQKTTAVVNIPQYRSHVPTSADDPIPTRSHRDSVYRVSMSYEGSLSVPVR